MKTNLNRTISTQEEAEAFLNELFENGESFHPEDDAHNIIRIATGERLFTDEEADKLNDLMSSLYEKDFDSDFDPCGYLLDLQGRGRAENEFSKTKRGLLRGTSPAFSLRGEVNQKNKA